MVGPFSKSALISTKGSYRHFTEIYIGTKISVDIKLPLLELFSSPVIFITRLPHSCTHLNTLCRLHSNCSPTKRHHHHQHPITVIDHRCDSKFLDDEASTKNSDLLVDVSSDTFLQPGSSLRMCPVHYGTTPRATATTTTTPYSSESSRATNTSTRTNSILSYERYDYFGCTEHDGRDWQSLERIGSLWFTRSRGILISNRNVFGIIITGVL